MHTTNAKLFSHLKNVTINNKGVSYYDFNKKSYFFFQFFLKNKLIRGFQFGLKKKNFSFFSNRKMFFLIKRIQLFSKPGSKKYTKLKNLKELIYNNNDFGLISTSDKGIISFNKSVLLHLAGEIVFYSKLK